VLWYIFIDYIKKVYINNKHIFLKIRIQCLWINVIVWNLIKNKVTNIARDFLNWSYSWVKPLLASSIGAFVANFYCGLFIRCLLRFEYQLPHPILCTTLAIDKKLPLSHFHISYQNLEISWQKKGLILVNKLL
jgi:hypothetical protein